MSDCVLGLKQKENIEWILENDLNLKKYQNSCVFVTGATGLIGTQLIRVFMFANRKKKF